MCSNWHYNCFPLLLLYVENNPPQSSSSQTTLSDGWKKKKGYSISSTEFNDRATAVESLIIDTGYSMALLDKPSFSNLLKAYDQKCQPVGEFV